MRALLIILLSQALATLAPTQSVVERTLDLGGSGFRKEMRARSRVVRHSKASNIITIFSKAIKGIEPGVNVLRRAETRRIRDSQDECASGSLISLPSR